MILFVIIASLVVVINVELSSSRLITPLDSRIVGGVNTTIEIHPHQVSLQYFGRHVCGGSIISENYVLTAKHCVEDFNSKYLSIRAGSTYHNRGGTLHDIKKCIIHYTGDIAVIKVKQPFELGKTRKPIPLFEKDEPAKAGALAVTTGWGTTEYGGSSLSDQLQNVTVPIVSREKCNEIYNGWVLKDEICAGYLGEGGKDSCQGDSGGPLTINGTQAGIVSWGIGCARPEYPGVYVEVAYYRDWIRHKTNV